MDDPVFWEVPSWTSPPMFHLPHEVSPLDRAIHPEDLLCYEDMPNYDVIDLTNDTDDEDAIYDIICLDEGEVGLLQDLTLWDEIL